MRSRLCVAFLLAIILQAPAYAASRETPPEGRQPGATLSERIWLEEIVRKLAAAGYEVSSAKARRGGYSLEARYRGGIGPPRSPTASAENR